MALDSLVIGLHMPNKGIGGHRFKKLGVHTKGGVVDSLNWDFLGVDEAGEDSHQSESGLTLGLGYTVVLGRGKCKMDMVALGESVLEEVAEECWLGGK